MNEKDFETQCKLLCHICRKDMHVTPLSGKWYHIDYFLTHNTKNTLHNQKITNANQFLCLASSIRKLYENKDK